MAVDRKQQMKEITERLERGVKDIFTSEMYTTYLRTMAKFHNYSFNNTLLIAMQRPDATLVAGFNAWKNKFNRYVKKGEKGIQIIAPAPIKEVEEREKIDKDTGLAVLNENGEPEMERVEYVVPRFRVTTVFDVSQTDGEPIPSLEVNELTASVKDYALLTVAIEQVSPVPIRFDEIEGEAKGYYSDIEKEICIQVGMGESQTIKTMIHEVAHAMLHNSDLMKKNGECKQAIHEAIADNYDGMHLGDDAVNQVVKQYGMERVGYILANTLRYKNYDDRFSHSNKEWAEQVGTPENNARIIKFRADWVVTSHSAVLDGFVTMYREKLEKQKELEQPFVKRFYVVENRQAVPLEIKRFGNLNDAMSQYQVLPNHYMKALGVEKNPDPLPGSLDILQCRNGLDTIVEDYKTVPGWNNPYIQNHVVQPLQGALAVQDVELAYELPDAYFHIQTCDDGFDYTLYNKDFTERDGGILETDGDKPVQEAMTELLAEFGCDAAEGKVMDAAELREQANMVAEQQAEVLKEKLAAERPAPEETLSFYVAECLEFTFAGEFHDHLTMEEALEAYDKIPSERMNADKCIGFCIEEDGGFVGMYELVVNDKVQRENINSINYFRDDKLVQQAISDMEKLMAARQQSKEQERSSTKKSVLDALHSLKAKKQEQPAQEQDKPKKAKTKGMEL